MPEDKRYTLTIDLYLYARNDREAMAKAALLAKELRDKEDNHAQVISLDKTRFASAESVNIHTGRLTIFENKLIEPPNPSS